MQPDNLHSESYLIFPANFRREPQGLSLEESRALIRDLHDVRTQLRLSKDSQVFAWHHLCALCPRRPNVCMIRDSHDMRIHRRQPEGAHVCTCQCLVPVCHMCFLILPLSSCGTRSNSLLTRVHAIATHTNCNGHCSQRPFLSCPLPALPAPTFSCTSSISDMEYSNFPSFSGRHAGRAVEPPQRGEKSATGSV